MSYYEPMRERLGIEKTTSRKKKEPLDNLTRDALAAQAAGQSYGQYKAAHPHTGSNPPPDPDPGRDTFTCAWCGAVVVTRGKARRKYCCENCRQNYQRQKDKERKEAMKNGSM